VGSSLTIFQRIYEGKPERLILFFRLKVSRSGLFSSFVFLFLFLKNRSSCLSLTFESHVAVARDVLIVPKVKEWFYGEG